MSAHFSEIYFRIMEDIEAERTFNTLRRMDFFQLLEIITEPWHSVNPDREDLYAKMIKLFSEEPVKVNEEAWENFNTGWTIEEFVDECKRRYSKVKHDKSW